MTRQTKTSFPQWTQSVWCILVFVCLYFFIQPLSAQEFTFITDKEHPFVGCIQLVMPPNTNTISPYKNEDLQVFLFPQNPDNPTRPIIGDWTRDKEHLYFCPLIPFTKNLTYQARFPELPYFTFKPVPDKDYLLTEMIAVHPTISSLPENNLKMYLSFSAPMSEGHAYQYLSLEDGTGKEIAAPYLQLKPELWNEDRTRLTLWFDPGRVKRDLIKNKVLGAPLENGKTYTLRISKNWKDANGYSLAKNFEKNFQVVPADRISPMPNSWVISSPKANTQQPLVIDFGESLDHALIQKSLIVLTSDGQVMEGEIQLKHYDSQWSFLPNANWPKGKFQIQIQAILEDLAGNNLNRLFDRDLENTKLQKTDTPFYYLDFNIQ